MGFLFIRLLLVLLTVWLGQLYLQKGNACHLYLELNHGDLSKLSYLKSVEEIC